MTEAVTGNNPEGFLRITLRPEAEGFNVNIHSERPLLACKVFEGKPVRQSLQLIPLLFSVCGQAQSVAAVRAVENALNCPASATVEEQREILVLLEGIREHLWRIQMDWPKIIDGHANAGEFAPINRSLTTLLQLANPEKLATTEPGQSIPQRAISKAFNQEWANTSSAITHALFSGIDLSLSDLQLPENCESNRLLKRTIELDWSNLGDMALPPLPELASQALADRLTAADDAEYIAKPTWNNLCCETGPFARQSSHPALQAVTERHGYGVYTRMYARIVELIQFMALVDAHISGARVIHQKESEPGSGLCQLEAVRGRLVHHVSIKNNQIDRFRILAPTEWNFHPRGIVSQILSKLSPTSLEETAKQAELLIKLIDPCVGYKLQFNSEQSGADHA